jgi:hypothetical protein
MTDDDNHHSSDYYENITITRSPQYDTIIKALGIVRQFIVDNNLILVGGMAIDYSLKLKGDFIYGDNQLPDYDFYSMTHVEHAYELSTILCNSGFKNISCIQAAHITTMRVRIDFEVVADITFCPKPIFDKVPILLYDKFRIVHPHYQMMDQHISLSLPFQDPGFEVIFNRWKKDLIRYDKLYQYYPIVAVMSDIMSADTGLTIDIEDKNKSKYIVSRDAKSKKESKKEEIKGAVEESARMIPSRGYIRTKYREELSKKLELKLYDIIIPLSYFENTCISGWGSVDYKVIGENIHMFIPKDEPITISSDDYKDFLEKNKTIISDIQYFSEYSGKIPRRLTCMIDIQIDRKMSNLKSSTNNRIVEKYKLEIYDTYGMKVSASLLHEELNVYICNLQWSMLYLLVKIFKSDQPDIVFTAEEQYLRCRELVYSGMVPSIEVYGRYNFTHAYLNRRKTDKERMYGIKPNQMQPSNAYPKYPNCDLKNTFDYTKSEYFLTDGRKLDEFINWTINPYPEYTNKSIKL